MKTSARFLVHLLVCFVAPFSFLSSIVPATSAQTYNFGQATLPAGKQPQSIATGDLNGDGILDLVVVNQTDSTLDIYLGQPNGSFTLTNTYPAGPDSIDSVGPAGSYVGSYPTWVILGDFNNDGVLDVVVDNSACLLIGHISSYGCGASYVSVFLGNGDGTFQARQDFSVPSGALLVQAADMNGDGKLDLVVASNLAGSFVDTKVSVSVLLGNGDGTFQPHIDYATPAGESTLGFGGTAWVVIADFNGDGKPDVAASNGAQGVAVFLGNGDGTLQNPLTFALPEGAAYGFYSGAVAGDFNADGKQDLAITTEFNSNTAGPSPIGLIVCLGNGDGTFTVMNPAGLGFGPVVAADLNGDGKLDLVMVNPDQNSVQPALGNGNGTFTATTITSANGFGGPSSVAVGDFNGDGQPDLAITVINDSPCPGCTTVQGSIRVLLGEGNGNFGTSTNEAFKSVYPSSLAFGSQGLTTTSTAKTIALGNPSATAFTVSSITASGPFSQTNHCPATISPGQSCTINVTFVPMILGTNNGTITITDTTHASPQVIPLTGTGVNGPFLQFSPGRLLFAATAVGSTTAAQQVELANTGNAALAISSIGITGSGTKDFGESTTCGSNLAPEGKCTISVTFAPTTGGASTATLTITDLASGSPNTVPLSGTGLMPQPSLSTPSLAFGTQQVGNTSVPQSVALSNTGTAALNITQISASGDFAQANNCGTSLPAVSGTCQISVTFTPTTTGSRTGTLTITDNASGSPQTVTLTGTGEVAPPPPAPVVSLAPATVTFPSQYVGTSGLPQTVTVANAGNATLNMTGASASPGDFGVLSVCNNPVAAGASCTIGVFFDPTAGGTRTGTLKITDNAGNSPQTVALTGSGQDFSMTPGAAASATVSAGQTASYSIAVAPAGGFAASVALSCSGGPAGSACAVSPSTIALSGAAAQTAMVTVTTAAHGWVLPFRGGWPRETTYRQTPMILTFAAMLLLMAVASQFLRREQNLAWIRVVGFAALVTLGLTLTSCGGGSSSSGGGTNPQAGTYTVTVTGNFTSGATTLNHTARLTLVVQ